MNLLKSIETAGVRKSLLIFIDSLLTIASITADSTVLSKQKLWQACCHHRLLRRLSSSYSNSESQFNYQANAIKSVSTWYYQAKR